MRKYAEIKAATYCITRCTPIPDASIPDIDLRLVLDVRKADGTTTTVVTDTCITEDDWCGLPTIEANARNLLKILTEQFSIAVSEARAL